MKEYKLFADGTQDCSLFLERLSETHAIIEAIENHIICYFCGMPVAIQNTLKGQYLFAAACVCTVLVYAGFLTYGYISWDDPEMVFKNEAVKNFDIKTLFTNQFVGNYIPMTMMAHSLVWAVFGDSAGGHHLFSILLHLLNGFLVLKLGEKLFKEKTIANAGAIIFLLHPMQVESVGWISELKNVLSATFFLAAILVYIRSDVKYKLWNYFICLLLFIAACLSKPSAVVLPLCLFCVDLFLNKKIVVRKMVLLLPLLLISVVFGIINIKSQTAAMFINHSHEFPYYQRIGLAGYALLQYLILFLAPLNLSVIYPYPNINAGSLIVGFAFLAACITLVIVFIRKKNYQWLAVLLFVICNFVLVLQLLPFGEVLYADRYIYVAIIGLGWTVGAFVDQVRLPGNVSGIVLIILFSILTFGRGRTWKNAVTLYEDIIKKYPDEYVALNSAGVESMFLNRDEKALEYFDRAIAAAPRNYKSYYNRGLLFLKNNKPADALKSFNQVLELYDYVKAYSGRASAYYLLNDLPKAISDANRVLQMDPNNAKAHFILGNCFNDMNQLEKAIASYNQAIRTNGNEPDYYFKRAIAKGKQQNFKACLDDLEVCIALNSEYHEAYYWRGVAKVNLNMDPCPDLKVAARHNFEPAVIAYNKFCR